MKKELFNMSNLGNATLSTPSVFSFGSPTHPLMSTSVLKIAPALLRAQKKMGGAAKGANNPFFKSKYSDYNSVLEVIKEPLNEEGILILQPTSSDANGHYVETLLIHESGEFISSGKMRLELDKVDMQKLGSAVTYARRYQAQSLLSIPSVDDDGESTMKRETSVSDTSKATASVATKQVVSSFKKPSSTAPATEATPAATPAAKGKGLDW
jgi:hypothetical protein